MTRRIDTDRDARATRVALEVINVERTEREAKTAKLREERLAYEAANPSLKSKPLASKAAKRSG